MTIVAVRIESVSAVLSSWPSELPHVDKSIPTIKNTKQIPSSVPNRSTFHTSATAVVDIGSVDLMVSTNEAAEREKAVFDARKSMALKSPAKTKSTDEEESFSLTFQGHG